MKKIIVNTTLTLTALASFLAAGTAFGGLFLLFATTCCASVIGLANYNGWLTNRDL